MQDYQREFVAFAIEQQVLRFGEFTLKSGRTSPYFFNAGLFNSGAALAKLAAFYAQAIEASAVDFDVLFGPAYKGIPLAATTAMAIYQQYDKDVPYAFNRKEKKAHGEGGQLVGAELAGNSVLIIDDVITAGTAIREVMTILDGCNAKPAGVVIALDRQERGQGERSAIQEVEEEFGIPVVSIIKLEQLIDYVKNEDQLQAEYTALSQYREQYGISL